MQKLLHRSRAFDLNNKTALSITKTEKRTQKTNDKKAARLESIRFVLSQFEYDRKGQSNSTILADPNVAQRYHRMINQID